MKNNSKFESQLYAFVKYLNENYETDKVEGMFFIVHAYYGDKKTIFNKLSFSVHYYINDLKAYCQDLLPLLWAFDYFEPDKLKVDVYNCCLVSESSKIEYRIYGEGDYDAEGKFVLKLL